MKRATNDEPRAELARLAASLRAYVEWQQETGAIGFPRQDSRSAPTSSHAPLVGAMSGAVHSPERHPGSVSARAAERLEAAADAGEIKGRLVVLRDLSERVSGCTKCGLSATRTQTVFARGNPGARLCFIGEAPGADEDEQGLPFVGRAGQLLDRMIQAMGLDPAHDVYICNILKCRPPGNRRPEPEEMACCFPYLDEQLAIVKPAVIVALGNTAVAALLESKMGITKLRGQWKLYRGILVMPTYHPSYLLRPSPQQAEAKRQAWQDLQLVMLELGLAVPSR